MATCRFCGQLPPPGKRSGRLFASAPCAQSEATLTHWLSHRGIPSKRTNSGLLRFEVTTELMAEFCFAAESLFGGDAMPEVKLTIADLDVFELNHRDILKMESANQFVGRLNGEWLINRLREGHLENAFHPMVNPQTGEIEAYECLMRAVLSDGRVKTPAEMIATARAAGLMLQLDRVARVSAIHNAAKKNISETVFVNFNPSTTCDPKVCLQSTVAAAREAGIHPSRIVFEVTESEFVTDANHLKLVLDFYRSEGFRIALDDLGSGYSSLNLLTELRPDFVKLDMALIRNIDLDRYKQHVTGSLLDMANCLGVRTVVEGVETAGEWDWAANHGADMIQGYFFARPAFSPPVGPDFATWSNRPFAAVRATA